MTRIDGAPRQARSKARLGQILDAADAVLLRRRTAEFTLPEVAQEAGLPPASVYHYVPTSQTLLLALARRYMETFEAMAAQPVPHEAVRVWTDLLRIHCARSLDFYRAHPVAMRLILGPESGWQIRSADLEANRSIGMIQYRHLLRHFIVAESEVLERAFPVSMTIGDAVWALSFAREGHVAPDLAEESLRARTAYLRLYIGEHAARREGSLEEQP